jgi:putative endonuclease
LRRVAESKLQSQPTRHYVYIVRCGDGSYYTGCTKNVEGRVRRHNGELRGGARYTRTRRPVVLVHCEEFASLAEARRRERALKRLSRTAKELLIAGHLRAGSAAHAARARGTQMAAARKKVSTRIKVDELYKKLRKPMPKPTVVHRDRKCYSRKQKHPRIPEEEE